MFNVSLPLFLKISFKTISSVLKMIVSQSRQKLLMLSLPITTKITYVVSPNHDQNHF